MKVLILFMIILVVIIADAPRYKQFPGGDQNQKPLLYIGGIFPISKSAKFSAPELVPGEATNLTKSGILICVTKIILH